MREKTGDSGLWGIVNNAGWATFGEVEWVGMDTYRKAMDINVFGLIQGIQTFLPLIRKVCSMTRSLLVKPLTRA